MDRPASAPEWFEYAHLQWYTITEVDVERNEYVGLRFVFALQTSDDQTRGRGSRWLSFKNELGAQGWFIEQAGADSFRLAGTMPPAWVLDEELSDVV